MRIRVNQFGVDREGPPRQVRSDGSRETRFRTDVCPTFFGHMMHPSCCTDRPHRVNYSGISGILRWPRGFRSLVFVCWWIGRRLVVGGSSCSFMRRSDFSICGLGESD